MKKYIIFLLLCCSTALFAQRRILVTSVDYDHVGYDIYDGATVVALNQLYTITDYTLTNAQFRTDILAEADDVFNIDLTQYAGKTFDLGDGYEAAADSAKVDGNTFIVYSRIIDDNDSTFFADEWGIDNSTDYTVAEIKARFKTWATSIKDGEVFVRAKSQFIGVFVD